MAIVQGIEMCRRFYFDAVKPILDSEFGGLKHAAALLGKGSEVLSYDTDMSRDHDFGPRAMIFLKENDYHLKDTITSAMSAKLPREFMGLSTNWGEELANDPGTRLLTPSDSGPLNHRVEMFTVNGYVRDYLGLDLDVMSTADWLSTPSQLLLSFAHGTIYHDSISLSTAQSKLSYYPTDIWLYLLASIWASIGQEEHLMSRAGHAGSELGSSWIASRLVTLCMKLGFAMERRYPPYAKWFGAAFGQLSCGQEMEPLLDTVLRASTWEERGDALALVYELLARKHNALQIATEMHTTVEMFWNRPFKVIWGQKFADAILAKIEDEEVKKLPLIGSVDIFSDSTEFLEVFPKEVKGRLYN